MLVFEIIGHCNIAIPLMQLVSIGPSFVTVPHGIGHGTVSGI